MKVEQRYYMYLVYKQNKTEKIPLTVVRKQFRRRNEYALITRQLFEIKQNPPQFDFMFSGIVLIESAGG